MLTTADFVVIGVISVPIVGLCLKALDRVLMEWDSTWAAIASGFVIWVVCMLVLFAVAMYKGAL